MASAGRRPGPTGTRDDILLAARRLFAAKGYDATTLRAIAAEAGVNPAMIRHFFGTKEQVFVAILDLPVSPAVVVPAVVDGPPEEFGRRVAGFLLSMWREPATRAPLLALVRSSTSNEQAAQVLREFLDITVVRRVAEALDVPPVRIATAISHGIGMLLARYVIGIEPLAAAGEDEIADLLGTAIQHAVDPVAPPAPRVDTGAPPPINYTYG
jgi:AcrR family transcriptional regulator